MRSILAIFLLSALCYQFVAKMGIIAWYELNKDYVAETLCENKDKPELECNGKCYLSKQLKKVDNETKSEQDQQLPQKVQKLEIPLFLTTECIHMPYVAVMNAPKVIFQYEASAGIGPLSDIFHPPRVC